MKISEKYIDGKQLCNLYLPNGDSLFAILSGGSGKHLTYPTRSLQHCSPIQTFHLNSCQANSLCSFRCDN